MMRKGFLLVILMFSVGLTNLLAQGTTGQISGTVTDPNGAVISGASVKVTSADAEFGKSGGEIAECDFENCRKRKSFVFF